ncbi:PREDICTED: secretory carrier-associated membrane protein 1 isoform X2 [Fragaria vesca subsp. vesca]|uniref:secretory carrier-associated membrane protein 1 isoform X2 n=1 Tax=Fragaria vesca subsp. vesca TaxID=101020 RepID=UPI0002C33601|nr:PREDICTED: secretory carrier-associated membrane protein 1 isoform X2 [Fragaria vesca subsp. vesca]
MSRYEANPFAEDDVNPFAGGGSRLTPLPPEPYDRGATVDIPLDNSRSFKKKEKELKAKEAELSRKERELRKQEEAIEKAGGKVVKDKKNFPPFAPIIHHDIQNDVPIHLQKIMYVAFSTFLGFAFCMFWSIVAASVYCVNGGWLGTGIGAVILSIFNFIIVCPLAYFLWYRPLYRAMRTDSALSFAGFFLSYCLHIGFCVFCSISPPVLWSGATIAGIIPAVVYARNLFVQMFYFIGFGLYVCETLLCLWVLKQVYTYFRGSGKGPSEATREAMRAAI